MKPTLAAGADWHSLHERLERVRREVERLTEPGPQWRQEILRERALALARGGGSGQAALAADAADSADSLETIEFKAGGERYAVETAHVAHVHPMLPITPLPGVPVFIAGIVARQGEVVAVVDLRSLLNLPLSGLAEPVAIIVLQGAGREFGILAEEIVGIARYRGDAMAGGPQGMAGIDPAYLKGVTPGRCAILDARQLLSDPRLVIDIA